MLPRSPQEWWHRPSRITLALLSPQSEHSKVPCTVAQPGPVLEMLNAIGKPENAESWIRNSIDSENASWAWGTASIKCAIRAPQSLKKRFANWKHPAYRLADWLWLGQWNHRQKKFWLKSIRIILSKRTSSFTQRSFSTLSIFQIIYSARCLQLGELVDGWLT